jgi:hypothetical protein
MLDLLAYDHILYNLTSGLLFYLWLASIAAAGYRFYS